MADPDFAKINFSESRLRNYLIHSGAVLKAEVLPAGPEELPRAEVLLAEVLLLWPGLLNGGST